MRFMVIRKADEETEAGVLPTTDLIQAMGDYMEAAVKAGIMVSGDGLHPSSKAARVKFNDGSPKVIDGPFAEAKELVGGYSIIEVPSMQAAIDWVKKWPREDGHGNVEIDIFPILTEDDFGDAFTADQRERERRLREEGEARHG
ncbi:YciI family protein [Devosia sp. D6-9]|nr:YciI family protein [Devosia sp. D6-9]